MEVDLSIGVCGATIFLVRPNLLIFEGHAMVDPGVLFDSNEVVVLFLIGHAFHVLVKVIVNIFIAVAGVECFDEQLMIILSQILAILHQNLILMR